MAERVEVDMIVKAITQGFEKISTDMQTTEKAVAQTGEAAQSAGLKWTEFKSQLDVVTGGAQKFIQAAQQIYEFGKEGAIFAQTEESFDGLLERLEVAPDLMDQLRESSKGTVDDLTLMSGGLTLVAGSSDKMAKELLEAGPELLNIAKAANKLNPTLGTTAEQYASISLGIKRASPMILDNLGIIIKVGEANESYAASIGKTVDELTAQDKTLAMLQATLESGNQIITQVGGSVESATDAFERFEAEMTNFKNQAAKEAYPAIADLVSVFSDLTEAAFESKKSLETVDVAGESLWSRMIHSVPILNGVLGAWESLNKGLQAYKELTGQVEAGTELVISAKDRWAGTLDKATISLDEERVAGEKAHLEMKRGKDVLDDYYNSMEYVKEATEKVKEAQKELKDELKDLQLFIAGPLGKEIEDFTKKQKDLEDQVAEVEAQIKELNKVENLTEEQEEELDLAKEKYEELTEKIAENADEHDEATKRIMFNLLSQRAAMDGLTEQELDQLNKIALHWDLVDQATFDYVTNADAYFQLLEDDTIETMGIVRWELEKTIGIMGETSSATQLIIDKFGNLRSTLEGLSGTYDIKIRQFYERYGDPWEGLGNPPGPPAPGGQHGLDMIVPPGFPGDSYPIWATSGEHVKITPQNEYRSLGARSGEGDSSITYNIYPTYSRFSDEESLNRDIRLLELMHSG